MVEMSDVVCSKFSNISHRAHKSDHVGRRQAFILADYIFIHSDLIPTKSFTLQLDPLLYNLHDRNISGMRSNKGLRVCID